MLAGLIENQVDDVIAAYQPYFNIDKPYHYENHEDRHWYRLSAIKHSLTD